MAGRRGFGGRLDEREVVFLANYYGADSKTKGQGVASALAAGYSDSVAHTRWTRILKKYEDCSFRSSARAVGITKPYLAMKLKQIMETGGDKEILAGLRLTLANFGETTDQSGGNLNVNSSGPVMVIVGATEERMKALRAAAAQPTREELEAQRNERVEKRMKLLKAGFNPPLVKGDRDRPLRNQPDILEVYEQLPPEEKAKYGLEAEVQNLDAGHARGDQETPA